MINKNAKCKFEPAIDSVQEETSSSAEQSNKENIPSDIGCSNSNEHAIDSMQEETSSSAEQSNKENIPSDIGCSNSNEHAIDSVQEETSSSAEQSNKENIPSDIGCSNSNEHAIDSVQEETSSSAEQSNKENIPSDIGCPNSIAEDSQSHTEKSPRGRKRQRDEHSWKRNVLKKLRSTGQSYTSSRRTREARTMKKGCGGACRKKCHQKITEEQRQELFHEFWSLGDTNRQRDYLCSWVVVKVKKSKTNQANPSRRQLSKSWQFKINGKIITVCKTFFLHTLDISHTVVESAVKTALTGDSLSGIASSDGRGKHVTRANKTSELQIEQVKSHISSFPRVESHYCRKDTTKEYLEPGLSIPKMYSLYENYCKENAYIPVSIHSYRRIFVTSFNISFHKPLKDKCDLCARYEKATTVDKSLMEEDYQCHVKNKLWLREMKTTDKQKAIRDTSISVACFDLQQILLTPHSNESVLYYSRKLCTFNLTIYDLGSKQGNCFIWNEAISGRGPAEIATCVFKHLEGIAENQVKEVILYSDNCGGQNRNKHFLTMLCYAKQMLPFKKIEHKFLERGHTQNENDSIHAAIECNSRGRSIYTTPQWAATVRTARHKAPYAVSELDSTDFMDFKQLSTCVPNFNVDSDGEKVKWLQIRSVCFENENSGIVNICYRNFRTATLNLGTRKTRVVRSQVENNQPFTLPPCKPLYGPGVNKLPTVSAPKYQALMHLCKNGVIPTVHHQFFKNLRHEID